MRETKKIAMSALLVALGVVFMTAGAYIEALDLTAAALSSVIMVLVYIEIGAPYTYLVWLLTSLLGFVFFPGSAVWLEYFLVFGIFPILKAYIEKLPRPTWLLIKVSYANITFLVLFWLMENLLGMPFDTGESIFGITGKPLIVFVWLIMNIAFFAYDMLLSLVARIYVYKYRGRFKNFFK